MYSLHNLTTANKLAVWREIDVMVPQMVYVLRRGYSVRSSGQLEYQEFALSINSLNDVDITSMVTADAATGSTELYNALDISNFWSLPLYLDVTIDIVSTSGSLVTGNTDSQFAEWTEGEFQDLFNNSNATFKVETAESELEVVLKDTGVESTDNTALIWVIVIASGGFMAAGCAFIWDKLPMTNSDDSSWITPLLVAIHLYDFLSDILLSITIGTAAAEEGIEWESTLLWLFVGSVATIVIPLLVNTFYAMRIQGEESVKGNPSARAWSVLCK